MVEIAYIVIFLVVILLLTLIADPLSRLLRLPFALLLVVIGFLVSELVVKFGIDTGIRAGNFHDLVFYLFLPVLIFEAAYHMDTKLLLRNLLPILMLAIAGMMLSAILIAIGVYYGIGHPAGFPWIAALITGALLAATDPVSVVEQLKSLGAPKRLAILLEGESLFNDATAVVLFSLLLVIATGTVDAAQSVGWLDGLISFFQVFFAGILVGILVGGCGILFFKLHSNPLGQTMASIIVAYTAFFLAEQGWQVSENNDLHASGVIAVLVGGLMLAWARERYTTPATNESVDFVWQFISYVVNAAVFLLVGLTITVSMFQERWLAIVIAVIAAFIARLLMVMITLSPLSPFKSHRLSGPYQAVISWGGLRGAVAVALSLSLPVELDYWWTIQSITFGVVLFTLLVQAPTMPLLLKLLKLER